MSTPLLTTKLHVRQLRPSLATRRRMIERLDRGLRLGRNPTLVSAPAGYGKTTLKIDSCRWLAFVPAVDDRAARGGFALQTPSGGEIPQVMGLGLADDDLATLAARTEGWITGKHLAAHSTRHA